MTSRDRALLVLLLFGFGVLVLETRYEHRYAIEVYPEAWVPIVSSSVGVLACLLGFFRAKAARTVSTCLFVAVMLAGGFGFYRHTGLDKAKLMKFVNPSSKSNVVVGPPPGAPLGLVGLAAMGALATSGLFRPKKGG